MKNKIALISALFLLSTSHAQAKNYIIFDGNSLVAGYPANAHATGTSVTFPNGTDFPSLVLKALGPDWIGYSVAVSSRDLGQQIEDFDKNVSPIIAQAHKNGAKKIIIVNGGEPGNLLYFSPGGEFMQDMSYVALKVYADKVHGSGAKFIDITMPARGIQGGKDQTIEADIEAVNLRIRKNCVKEKVCDAVVPLDLDPRMQHAGDAKYYTDETHFNDQGYSIWANQVLKVVKKFSGEKIAK